MWGTKGPSLRPRYIGAVRSRTHMLINQSISLSIAEIMRIPVAARSKASVCGHSLGGIVGSNLAGGMDSFLC